MKSKIVEELASAVVEEFGPETGRKAIELAQERFSALCRENAADPKAVKAQTEQNLFPCMALYQGLQQAGADREKALDFLDRSWSRRAEPQARSIRCLLKIPGLYRLMPAIYKKVTLASFGEEAGFQAKFYNMGKTRCKFDMTKCLYCDVCRRYGCPELVPCFCHTDDVTSGRMHPKLKWNRTKTMGEGGDLCDFDLLIEEK